MSLTMEGAYQILNMLKAYENCALYVDAGDVKISIVKGNAVAVGAPVGPAHVGAATVAPATVCAAAGTPADEGPSAAGADHVDEAGLVPITANVTSVFYRRPSPDEAPFVEVGDEVQADTCVCLLEVMKCFRQVTADVRGRIAKILVDSGDLVEAGTVMFLVRPL